MQKKRFKIFWDLAMLIVLILLFEVKAIGLQFHEIAGLVIGAVFIVHIAVNWRFVQKITQHYWSKQVKLRTKIIYVIDILLFVSFLTIIVSGVLISKVLFPGLHYGNAHVLKTLHQSISYIALLLVGLHLGLNWKWVMGTTKKLFSFTSGRLPAYVSRAIAVLIVLFSIYSMTSVNLVSNIARLGQMTNASQPSGFEERVQSSSSQNGIGSSDASQNGPTISTGEYGNRPSPGEGTGISDERPGGKGPGHAGGSTGGSNLLLNLGTYLGIVGGFAVASYYLDMLLRRKKTKPAV